MEAVLEQMKATAKDLPPEEKEKLAKDLKVIESDKEAVEKVLQDMGASLDSVPKNDREVVKAQLREEAWQPTKDAIGVSSTLTPCPDGHLLPFVPPALLLPLLVLSLHSLGLKLTIRQLNWRAD